MTMHSPIVAIMWESWRLTRVEIAWRLAGGIVAASVVLVLFAVGSSSEALKGFGAAIALVILVAPNLMGWPSFLKLTGGRPGFPLHLLYTRPVRTAVLVGVPMAYRTVVPAAIYFGSALLLRGIFGSPFPLLPVAAWIAVLHVILTAGSWSTRKRVIHMLGTMAASAAWTVVGMDPLIGEIDFHDSTSVWPTLFDVPLAGYASMGVIGLASFGLTVAAVERQRHGDGWASPSWSGVGFPDALVSLFRFPCPTSSPAWAQVWFELRSRGLPVLTIGVALAIVNLLLYAVSGPIDALVNGEFRPDGNCPARGCLYARPVAMLIAMFSVPAVLALGGNAFGIFARQGRAYASAFEATQPYGTGRLAVLKVLVRSVCVLAALTAVGVSVLAPGSLIASGEIFGDPLSSVQRALEGAVGALTYYELFALAIASSIGVAVMVASRAALGALWTRYPRRLNIAGSLLLLYGVVLGLLALAGQRGLGPEIPLGAVLRATSWVAASAIVLATGYLLWRGFAEQLLTPGHVCGAVLVSAVFGAAWLTILRAADVSLAGMPAADAAWMLSPALLPLMAGVVAPWSLSRIRHT